MFRFFSERKRESEKLTVVPKKSSIRRQKVLQAEKVAGLVFFEVNITDLSRPLRIRCHATVFP